MKKIKASVIVPAYNCEKTIRLCLNALLNQSISKSAYEIIVIDNNSSDQTKKILSEFSSNVLVLSEKRQGAYFARETGCKKAKGELLLFTDSDCVADRDWISQMVTPFKNSHVKLVGGRIEALEVGNFIQKYWNDLCHNQNHSAQASKPFFGAGSMAVRKSDYLRVNGFDTQFKCSGDIKLCHEIVHDSKKEVVYTSKAVVYHSYDPTILNFISKHFIFGKWIEKYPKSIQRGMKSLPDLSSILSQYGPEFVFLRVVQHFSVLTGRYWSILTAAKV